MLHLLKVIPETILDGEGIRYAIYLAGCSHHCKGCHNAASQDPELGDLVSDELMDAIITEINGNVLLDGVTFSGGDPFYNPQEFLPFLKRIREETKLDIWCYTGYRYEDLLDDYLRKPLLEYIDVLVDGRYIQALHDPTLSFRGSSNQRIIKLRHGLWDGIVCESDE